MKKVSIIIPTYNAGNYLRQAVESALAIDHPDVTEVLVIDDGSTDISLSTISHLPVRIFHQQNSGEAAARNKGIELSTADYVTFLDADDLLLGEGIAKRIDHLDTHMDCMVVAGQPGHLINESGDTLANVHQVMLDKKNIPSLLTLDFYRQGNFYPAQCSIFLYRKGIFKTVGMFDTYFKLCTDFDMHLRILQANSVPVVHAPTFHRRLHSGNISLHAKADVFPTFKDEIITTVKFIHHKYGFPAIDEIYPWERDFLTKK